MIETTLRATKWKTCTSNYLNFKIEKAENKAKKWEKRCFVIQYFIPCLSTIWIRRCFCERTKIHCGRCIASRSLVYLCNSKAKQRKWNGFYSKYREKIKLMANWPNKAVNWKSHVFIHIVYSIQQNFLEASHLLLLLLTVFFSMQCNAMQCRWSASSSDEMNGKIHTVQSIFLFFVFSLIGICHLP